MHEHVKYADLVESLKINKEIKGVQKYVAEDILPVLEVVEDQTISKVLKILTLNVLQLVLLEFCYFLMLGCSDQT